MDNQSKVEGEIFILHEIDEFYSNSNDIDKFDKYDRKIITKSRHREHTEIQSLEKFRRFNMVVKNLNLNQKELDLGDLEATKNEFVEFILRDRIKIRMKYKNFLSLNDKYDLFFFPECPNDLIYQTFILFSSKIDELETSIIEYIDFIRKSDIKKYIVFKPYISVYCKVNKKFNYIQDFVNHFSHLEEHDIYRIKFESSQKDENFIEYTTLLIGKPNYYISIQYNYNDLSFYLFAKDYLKKFI